mgnify:FL=1
MKANTRNKESWNEFKLNIEHKELFYTIEKAVNDCIKDLTANKEQKERLHHLINNLIEVTEIDSFFTGFKAGVEFSREGNQNEN